MSETSSFYCCNTYEYIARKTRGILNFPFNSSVVWKSIQLYNHIIMISFRLQAPLGVIFFSKFPLRISAASSTCPAASQAYPSRLAISSAAVGNTFHSTAHPRPGGVLISDYKQNPNFMQRKRRSRVSWNFFCPDASRLCTLLSGYPQLPVAEESRCGK